MGVMKLFSGGSSSFDNCLNNNIIGNPNPKRFKILYEYKFLDKTLLIVNYPDSITFEGNKILLFDCDLNTKYLYSLDPHFYDDSLLIGRFKPNKEGIICAICCLLGMIYYTTPYGINIYDEMKGVLKIK